MTTQSPSLFAGVEARRTRQPYRRVSDITADMLLSVLTDEPQHQISLFIKLGGDPDDHNYARLSFLTRQLRERGVNVLSSRSKGIWLGRVDGVQGANQ